MDIFKCCRNMRVKFNNSPFGDDIVPFVSQVNTQVGPPSIADKNFAINRRNIDNISERRNIDNISERKNVDISDKNTTKAQRGDYSIEKLFNDIVVFQEKILTSDEFNKADKNFTKIKKFDTPQILCVGTQTSGKSSLVNNIIGYELLPTGDNMVTRTPLNVSLSNGSADTIQLYYIDNGKKITTYIDKFSTCDVEVLKIKIMETTDVITGGNYLISKSILYLEIVNPEVEDLVVIDLPGLISIACTDKGQPKSMVGDIKELIECQLSSNRVFVIAVIQSKVDLETDGGLGLIKDLGRKFDIKTIGVLTKPDLLDTRSLVKFEKIFTNEIPSDLQVDNGYYVVNNLEPFDASWYVNFFGKKSAIVTQKKFGIINFKQAIKKHINTFLKSHAHEVRKDLVITKDFLLKNKPSLNNTVEESSSKILYMITVTYILHRILCESFNSTGNMTNIGGDIRDIFDSFTHECNNMDPFNKTILSDDKLNKIIKNFDGYLPSHTKKINLIVNKCIADEDTQPIKKIVKSVDKCVSSLIDAVLKLTKNILTKQKVDIYPYELNTYNVNMQDYPKLIDFILEKTNEIFDRYTKNTLLMINNQLSIHEISTWISKTDIDYVHMHAMNELSDDIIDNLETDLGNARDESKLSNDGSCEYPADSSTTEPFNEQCEPNFKKAVKFDIDRNQGNKNLKNSQYMNIYSEPSYTPAEVRIFLNVIFKKIVKQINDIVIKTITALILKEFENKYFIEVTQIINKLTDIDFLFYASVDLIKEKKKYNDLLSEVNRFIECMDSL